MIGTYQMRGPTYYAVEIRGRKVFLQDKKDFYCVLENEDEIDEFAKKFDSDWSWNMRTGRISFRDNREGVVPYVRPTNVDMGTVITVHDDWGAWRFNLWDKDEFDKKFRKAD